MLPEGVERAVTVKPWATPAVMAGNPATAVPAAAAGLMAILVSVLVIKDDRAASVTDIDGELAVLERHREGVDAGIGGGGRCSGRAGPPGCRSC